MLMNSLTILFRSGMSRFMDEHVKKIRLLLKFAMRVLSQLLSDLWAYYASPYPFLLIMGVFRRIFRRAKTLWLPKGRGRPSVGEDVVELILDMKRNRQLVAINATLNPDRHWIKQLLRGQEYFNGRRPHQGINGKTPTKVIQLESRQTLIPAIRYSKTPALQRFDYKIGTFYLG